MEGMIEQKLSAPAVPEPKLTLAELRKKESTLWDKVELPEGSFPDDAVFYEGLRRHNEYVLKSLSPHVEGVDANRFLALAEKEMDRTKNTERYRIGKEFEKVRETREQVESEVRSINKLHQ